MSKNLYNWCDHVIRNYSINFPGQCSGCDLSTLREEIKLYGISNEFSQFLKSKNILTDCNFWELASRIL